MLSRILDWFDSLSGAIIVIVVLWRKRITALFYILRMVRSVSGLWQKPIKQKEFIMETLGVENLEKIIVIGAKLGNVGGKVWADKKVNTEDLVYIPELFMIFPDIPSVQWKQLVPEGKDVSAEEASQLLNAFNVAFDIPQDALETKIETVLEVISRVVAAISEIVALVKMLLSVSKTPAV
jgi:hypothetical protein